MDQVPSLTRLAVFGSPIKHSLSPRIHLGFADQAGIDVRYDRIEVGPEYLAREVQKLADAGGTGCNITLPLKEHAYRLCNRASERARLAQAANTLIFKSKTRWHADNTDGAGLVADLTRNLGIDLKDCRVCVIGAGGAVAGVLHELLLLHPDRIALFNRTPEKAIELAERFAPWGRVTAAGLDAMADSEPFDLVINATSTGQLRQPHVLEPALFGPESICYDLSYGKAHAGLSDWCGVQGVRSHDGLGMLVEQAAESFYLWTGVRPETAPVLTELRECPG